MYTLENVPLSGYSTMRLGGNARYLIEVSNRDEVVQAVSWAKQQNLPVIMIGSGSNIVWGDKGFNGLVLVNRIMGFEIFKEDDTNAYATVGAGEVWDSVVERIVKLGYSGVAELSLIPGTTGATPVQNVGAYGREISETLTTVEAYDSQTNQLVTLRGSDCAFSYRSSRFKTTDKGRFFIISITLHVSVTEPKPPFYASLQTYFTEHGITEYSVQTIRDAVVAIRSAKLPDPALVANNGSFFENPIIDDVQGQSLMQDYPTAVFWRQDNGSVKVSAAWLIEQAGLKDVHDESTGMATWAKQPLIFVNEKARNTADLLAFKQKIVDAVKAKFGIELKQEPEFIEL
jgi:UDP-N-acetylmuramate dehydrogenase